MCAQADIQVAALTDKQAYAPGDKPMLTLKVTNTGASACDVNVGTNQMAFIVTSGNDPVFNSQDCQVGGTDLVKTIAPGKSETANFPWQRNRTIAGCGKVESSLGAGTYVFTAQLGKIASNDARFTLN